jgi:hypothetical protein
MLVGVSKAEMDSWSVTANIILLVGIVRDVDCSTLIGHGHELPDKMQMHAKVRQFFLIN